MKTLGIIVLFSLSLLGCLQTSHKMECPPLAWNETEHIFKSTFSLSSGHPHIYVGVDYLPSGQYPSWLLEEKVKCSITNLGNETLKLSWIAINKFEQSGGELVRQFPEGDQKRRVFLGDNETVSWFYRPFRDLLGIEYVTIQQIHGKTDGNWNIEFTLELDYVPNHVDNAKLSTVVIPIKAVSKDNV